MTNSTQILSTKTLSSIQKNELLGTGFEVSEFNFIEVKHTDFELPIIKNEILIFTSKNAVLSLLKHKNSEQLKKNTVFCVGLKTKALLEEHGFQVEVYVDYAEDLAEIISLIYKEEKFIFFSGNLRKETLPKSLKAAKINIKEIEVYETILTPQIIKNQLDGILFFSPSGVESYLQKNTIKNEICFCIGKTTAETVEKHTKNSVIAEYPSTESLIDEIIKHYNR